MPTQTGLLIRASLNTVLANVKAQLVVYLPIAEQQVLIVARPRQRVPHLEGDQDIVLKVGGFLADGRHRGRHDCRVRRALWVIVRTRLELDEADRDDFWLTATSQTSTFGPGNVVLVEDVLDALQNYQPVDGQGNTLVYEPLRVIRGDDPEKDREQTEWGEAALLYELPLTLALSQTFQ